MRTASACHRSVAAGSISCTCVFCFAFPKGGIFSFGIGMCPRRPKSRQRYLKEYASRALKHVFVVVVVVVFGGEGVFPHGLGFWAA